MFLKSMITHYSLFDGSLDELRQKAAKINVKEFMHNLSTDECIDENAFLDDAIHTLIMGHHQSLLVSRGDIIVGILRLTDVFSAVFHTLASPPDSLNENP
jgi:signal-transduction protein with cAMP-binding, CBS, and nucleotidyltransferase domain